MILPIWMPVEKGTSKVWDSQIYYWLYITPSKRKKKTSIYGVWTWKALE